MPRTCGVYMTAAEGGAVFFVGWTNAPAFNPMRKWTGWDLNPYPLPSSSGQSLPEPLDVLAQDAVPIRHGGWIPKNLD